MARWIGIDYGTKKVGLAVTDPLRIIASPLKTIPTNEIFDFLENYLNQENVEKIVIGEPFNLDGSPAQIHHLVVGFFRKIEKKYPNIDVVFQDETYTSARAKAAIIESGVKKMKRRDKTLVDKVSAALILRDYMEEFDYKNN